MLKNTEIAKLSRRYVVQTILAVVVLSLAVLSLQMFAHVDGLVPPLVVSAVFTLVVELADIFIWKKIAETSEDALHTFFSAVSGLRMLLALFTLTGRCIAVGRDAMLEYCMVFLVFYFYMIIHHSAFFSHVNNSHTECDKEKNKR